MKKILFSNISKAYQSLRLIFDPATEGNPYRAENKTYRAYKSNWSYKPYQRYVIQGA